MKCQKRTRKKEKNFRLPMNTFSVFVLLECLLRNYVSVANGEKTRDRFISFALFVSVLFGHYEVLMIIVHATGNNYKWIRFFS